MKKYDKHDIDEALHNWNYIAGYCEFFFEELKQYDGITIHRDYLVEKIGYIKSKLDNILLLHDRNNPDEIPKEKNNG